MKLKWKTDRFINIGKYKIPVFIDEKTLNKGIVFIRKDSKFIFFIKKLLWPVFKYLSDFFIDGFIEKGVGRWLKKSLDKKSIFLDIGCGNTRLSNYLKNNIIYNAIDLSLSEFHLLRVMKKKNSNICFASANKIPIESNSVSIVTSTECFQHIQNFNQAIDEIYRILKPGAILICTNSNPYAFKYDQKGPHEGVYNKWTNSEFIEFMKSKNFKLIDNYMKGYWVPLPKWLNKISIQLPISSKKENLNTCFFYKLEVIK